MIPSIFQIDSARGLIFTFKFQKRSAVEKKISLKSICRSAGFLSVFRSTIYSLKKLDLILFNCVYCLFIASFAAYIFRTIFLHLELFVSVKL